MNLCLPGKPVDVLHTGAWTAKAIGELKKGVLHNIARVHGSGQVCAVAAARGDQALARRFLHLTFAATTPSRARSTRSCPLRSPRWWRILSSDIASRPLTFPSSADLCRGTEESWAQRRNRGDRAQGSGGARGQEFAFAAAIPHAHQEKSLYHTAATLCGVTSWAW